MKNTLEKILREAVESLQADKLLPPELPEEATVTRTRDKQHGDFTSNIAMTAAKAAGLPPRELAQRIRERLGVHGGIEKTQIAGPGFINFFLQPAANHAVVASILEAGDRYGRGQFGAGRKVQIEFVSANPTGPLHVGHGRGAAYGAAVANLLAAAGFDVQREYYVNDAGRQMDILCVSVWLRYLELCGERLVFPTNAYRGAYVRDIAAAVRESFGDCYRRRAHDVFYELPPDAPSGGDKEIYIDALVTRGKGLLGDKDYNVIFAAGLESILADIRDDLAGFGVVYDNWYSERGLAEHGAINRVVQKLRETGHTFEQDGALWFRASRFGDTKDRVLVRENGQNTYFAADIAYHQDKLERGFTQIIDVWGADHHGYAPRVKAALTALGYEPSRLDVLLVQFANLYRGGRKVQMSTRSGEFVTLRELRDEVGRDAARFFYVMRKSDQHLDFDLDLARSQSLDNPVFYIQYAHARICSVVRQLDEKQLTYDQTDGLANLDRLVEPRELGLLDRLARYPETVEAGATLREPHQLVHYLRALANDFHTYYNAHQFLVDDAALRNARLNLILATRQVIVSGLELLGVAAPEKM
ncbi:MAG: arginine--tRNA ligase [Gammaproteobacteria bacterium]|nr:arginine--tRNA ligase [Gammaproteobacteria bacterium]